MIVTVSGLIGSGKTTVAEAIKRKFEFRHISAGMIFREMARERGVSLEEFTKLAEGNHDFDRKVDKKQREMVEGNTVIDGRLSGWMVDADLKIWLKAPLETRARRVAEREKKSYEEALRETRQREKSELKRYREVYGIDLQDISSYDVVINTELWSAKDVIKIVENIIFLLKP